MLSLHATVYGRVQGVFFRQFVAERACRLGLIGYVRNLPDGASVEVVAEGPRASLEALLEHLRRGPPLARVDKVKATWALSSGTYRAFSVQ
ncbi:MAG: acylphosphatase [Chloroflexi bacterium]|nr:acylphosphatase [Chloroflexota bacterium]